MTRTPQHKVHWAAPAALLLALALSLSACGTRVSDQAILSAEGGAAVTGGSGVAGAPQDAGALPQAGSSGNQVGTGSGQPGVPQAAVPGGTTTSGGTGGAASAGTGANAGGGTSGAGTGGAGQSSSGGARMGQAVSCAKSGPPIKIGQVGTFSGFIATSVGQSRQALQVWAKYMNERGGVACHPVQLTQLDDASDPTKANAATKSLINDTKVSALVGVFSPIAMSGVRDGVKGSGVAVVGGDGADPIWTSTPGIYDVGAAIDSQVFLLSKAQANAGKKKVAIFWCVEANSCTSGGATATGDSKYGAKAAGQQIVYKASISATQPDFTAQCQSAKNAGADNIFIATESTSLTRFMQSCDSVGYYPPISTCGICMGFDVNNKTLQKFQVSSASPVFPYMRTDNAAQQTFAAAFKKYSPGAAPNGISAQTWTDGMMLQRALELLGPEAQTQQITPAMVLKGLGMVKRESLGGLVAPTTYTPNQAKSAPNPCGTLLLFNRGAWGATNKSTFACGV